MAVFFTKRGEPTATAKQASDYSVGEVLKLQEGTTSVNFIVVHQGNPNSSMYSESCNGTWVLREKLAHFVQWSTAQDNRFSISQIKTWLDGTYYASLGQETKNAAKQVKIPYTLGGMVGGGPIYTLEDGLECYTFPLSCAEMGMQYSGSMPADSAKLDYFLSGNSSEAFAKRVAYREDNGNANYVWTRSPFTSSAFYVYVTKNDGSDGTSYTNNTWAVRPCLILNSDTLFDPNTNVIKG